VYADYFHALGETMAAESRLMGTLYRHPGKLGENREALVAGFLREYLPQRFGVGTGFASFGQRLSTQQDVVVFDQHTNPILFATSAAPLFPPSALVAAIEVKSRLTKHTLAATVEKTRDLKRQLRAAFAHHPEPPRLEALVCLFVFGAASTPLRTAQTLAVLEQDIDARDRLDLICLLGTGLLLGGSMYAETTRFADTAGQERLAVEFDNSLFLFYSRLLDYALTRGEVPPRLMSYMSPETPMGIAVSYPVAAKKGRS
jgi:hypothetical protein